MSHSVDYDIIVLTFVNYLSQVNFHLLFFLLVYFTSFSANLKLELGMFAKVSCECISMCVFYMSANVCVCVCVWSYLVEVRRRYQIPKVRIT